MTETKGEFEKRINKWIDDLNYSNSDSYISDYEKATLKSIVGNAKKEFPKPFANYWQETKEASILITWNDKVKEWFVKWFGE